MGPFRSWLLILVQMSSDGECIQGRHHQTGIETSYEQAVRVLFCLVDNLFLANITCEHPGNSAASLSAESKSRTFPPCLSLILSDEITFLRLMALFDDDRIY